MSANSNYYSTEFGDDIIIKFSIPDAQSNGQIIEYTLGRIENIRYEDTEEARFARGVGSKFAIDSRTTRFLGNLRCNFKPTALNMGILQYALGALIETGKNIDDSPATNLMLMNQIFAGVKSPPLVLEDGNYIAPFRFSISIRNIRTGFQDELYNVLFTRRGKEVREGDFSLIELEGHYTFSLLSSTEVNSTTYSSS